MLEKPSKFLKTQTKSFLKSTSFSQVDLIQTTARLNPRTKKHFHTTSSSCVSDTTLTATSESSCKPIPKSDIIKKYSLSQEEQRELSSAEEIFYFSQNKYKSNSNHSDNKGYYRFFTNDHLDFRYQILQELGQGTFGSVLKCRDHKTNDLVAVKVLRNDPDILESGKNEIEVLNHLDSSAIVQKKIEFSFRGHFCIVFELLSMDLYEFLKKNRFQGVHCNFAKRVIVQVLCGLKQMHSKGIVHCDLKPENIALKHEGKSSVKIIDFGSAYKPGFCRFDYIQTRFYRAPEVILEKEWTEKIDIWSVGCVLLELLTGWPIFTGKTQEEVLFQMITILGTPPRHVMKTTKRTVKEVGIENVLEGYSKNLIDFVKGCLRWDPNERLSAEDALRHCWIKSSHVE